MNFSVHKPVCLQLSQLLRQHLFALIAGIDCRSRPNLRGVASSSQMMSSFHLPETIFIAVAKPFSVGLFTLLSLPAGNHLRLRAYWCRASQIIDLPRTTSEPSVAPIKYGMSK